MPVNSCHDSHSLLLSFYGHPSSRRFWLPQGFYGHPSSWFPKAYINSPPSWFSKTFMDTLRLGFPRLLWTPFVSVSQGFLTWWPYASCCYPSISPSWTSINMGNRFLHVMNGPLLEPGCCQDSIMAHCWQVLLGALRHSHSQSKKQSKDSPKDSLVRLSIRLI